MNLQQLEYFKKIAETENFTTAANLASVTQPALSKSISNLEKELNVSLFKRTGRNVKLTSFGEAFLKHTNLALLEIEKGLHELEDMTSSINEIVSIACTHCIGVSFIPFVLSNFLSNHSNIKFQFNYEFVPNILSDLKEGKIDLGFYDNTDIANKDSSITSIEVKKEEFVLLVSKNHRLSNYTEISLKELEDESFIVFSPDNKDIKLSYSEFIDYTPKIFMKPNDISMLGGLVTAGAGITIVPNSPIIDTNRVSPIKIKENIGHRTIYMGWFKNNYMASNVKIFRDYILSLVKNGTPLPLSEE